MSVSRTSAGSISAFILAWTFIIILAVIAVRGLRPPTPEPASAPPTEFSAYRAMSHVRGIARVPHPLGSAADAAARKYLLTQLASLGLETNVFTDIGINASSPFVAAGPVDDIVALLPGTTPGPAIMLMAHYDSVLGAPGAGDDASGVAAILEIVRAVHSGPPLRNDLVILLTDGEEEGLLGAEAFAHSPWISRVGLILNFEARGNRGPSLLFETSKGNSALINEVARTVPHPIGSSLFYALYKQLPNDTDFTVFRPLNVPGLNFAFGEGLDAYHSPLDTPDNLSLESLQHDGSYGLALLRELGQSDLTRLQHQSEDDVFFDWFGGRLIAYREKWAIPGEVLLTLLLLFTFLHSFRKQKAGLPGVSLCFLSCFCILLVATITAGSGWWIISRVLASRRIITDAPANLLLLSGLMLLSACTATVVLSWVRKQFSVQEISLSALSFWLVLSWLLALALPSASYLLFWPLLLANIGFLSAARSGTSGAYCAAGLPATAAAVLLFAPVIYLLYIFLTFQLISVAASGLLLSLFLLISVPFFTPAMGTSPRWIWSVLGVGALACIIPGIVLSGYGAERPRPDSILYSLNTDENSSAWITYDQRTDIWTQQFLPPGTSKLQPVQKYLGGMSRPLISSPAPVLPLSPPVAEVLEQHDDGNGAHMITLRVRSQRATDALYLRFPDPPHPALLKLAGKNIRLSKDNLSGLNLYAIGQQGIEVELALPGSSIAFWLMDRSDGLPLSAPPRPSELLAQNFSDVTIVCRKYSFSTIGAQKPR